MDLLTRRTLPSGVRTLGALAAAAFWAAAGAAALAGQGLTQEEALRTAFPDAEKVERRTAYLDDAQRARVAELAGPGVEAETGVITYYVALEGGRPAGVAYFDAHRVRTLPEVLMIVVDPDDRIRRIEVVRFSEPPEYAPPGGWLAQFDGRPLDDGLSLKGDIRRVTGATLTSVAVTDAARRTLALHRVIDPFGSAR